MAWAGRFGEHAAGEEEIEFGHVERAVPPGVTLVAFGSEFQLALAGLSLCFRHEIRNSKIRTKTSP